MSLINGRIIFRIIGFLLCVEAVFMLFPVGISLIYQEHDTFALGIAALITFSTGALLAFLNRNHSTQMGKREGSLIVTLSWVFFTAFGMLPFLISGYIDNVTDAVFETMSGFTTTGATILNNIDIWPHGLLFWRNLIQWLGGMGIIVFTLAIMPMLNSGGGIQLFNAEVPGVRHDKLRPRISQTAKRLWGIYVVITALCAFLLAIGPMDIFDAVCHAFSTLATGGYSTKQASIAYWHSAYIEYIIALFMFIGGINFSLVYFTANGNPRKLFKDEEFRWYLLTTLAFTVIVTIGLYIASKEYSTLEETFRIALFQVITIFTTTGFATADYVPWGSFFSMIFFILMFTGASAGSTSGGAKIIRMGILLKNTLNEFYRHIHPNAVVPVRINDHVISTETVSKVLAFILIYMMVLIISSLILAAVGLTFEEAFGSTLTCLGNIGPGLGRSGPSGSFAFIHPVGKWVLSFVMLVGRLELFTVLIIFSPYFWKK